MTTAEWGSFEWGVAEWGSAEAEDASPRATGSLALNGSGALTGFPTGVASGVFALNGSAVPTTSITAKGTGTLELNGSAKGFQARFIGRLSECGDPLSTAFQEWLLKDKEKK